MSVGQLLTIPASAALDWAVDGTFLPFLSWVGVVVLVVGFALFVGEQAHSHRGNDGSPGDLPMLDNGQNRGGNSVRRGSGSSGPSLRSFSSSFASS